MSLNPYNEAFSATSPAKPPIVPVNSRRAVRHGRAVTFWNA